MRLVWHTDADLEDVDVVVVPGGFSYGDYLRAGAIARFAPAMEAVASHADAGGAVLGICNGFQVLCEAGLLPGALLPNDSLRFVSRQVDVVVENAETPFTRGTEPGQRLSIPVKHESGRYFAPEDQLEALEAGGGVVLRYAEGHNPNGSVRGIAGVVNERGNVMGLDAPSRARRGPAHRVRRRPGDLPLARRRRLERPAGAAQRVADSWLASSSSTGARSSVSSPPRSGSISWR